MKKWISIVVVVLFSTGLFAQQKNKQGISVNVEGDQIKLYEESHALIIGMSNYNTGWNDLPGVERDISSVKDVLQKNGFRVTIKENLTKSQLDKAFTDFIAKNGQKVNNRLLFYFAGHGHTISTSYGDKLGYIVPVDAPHPDIDQSAFQAKAMEMQQIEIYAKRIHSKHALFLFDACFAGSLFAMRQAVPAVIDYKTSEPVRQFITSGSEDESVPDVSIFRQQFINALSGSDADANNDGFLTGTELGKYLQDRVVNYSYNNQHPQYGKIRHKALDKGDFVFKLPVKEKKKKLAERQKPKEKTQLVQGVISYSYGEIIIDSELKGKLYIDGELIGEIFADSKGNKISKQITGNHSIELRGEENWSGNVKVYKNQVAHIQIKSMKPKILIDSRDSKKYKTAVIGNQIWMAENLAYLPEVCPEFLNCGYWVYDFSGTNTQTAYNIENYNKYGVLYNYETALSICPEGWHLPSDNEWKQLEMALGMDSDAVDQAGYRGNDIGALLKSKNGWNYGVSGTNESGFNAYPGGLRYYSDGPYYRINESGYWWTSSSDDSNQAYYRKLNYQSNQIYRSVWFKSFGFSVRCVKN